MVSTPTPQGVVDAKWVEAHLEAPGVRLVEVDVSPATYAAGHLPGAVLWNAYSDLRDPAYLPVPAAAFQDLLSRSGITRETTVVTYGYGAFLGYWLLSAVGHPDVRVFAGGRDEWARHGGALTTAIPGPGAASYALPPADASILADRVAVERAVKDPTAVVLDVRSALEFTGDRFWPSGATADTGRAGHIPGAVSVPIELTRDEEGNLRDGDFLRDLYSRAGVSPASKVVVYCTIGNRASLAWYLLTEVLGYPDVAVYQGSYVEWGKLPDTKVETA